jgi:hypothetical protein
MFVLSFCLCVFLFTISLSLAHSCTLLHAVIRQDFSLIIPTTKPTKVALLLSYLSHLAFANSGQSEMKNPMSEVMHAMSGVRTSQQMNSAFSTISRQMNTRTFMTSQQGNSAPFAQQVPAQDYNKGYTVHQQPQPMQMGQMQPQPMQMGQMGDGMGLPPPPFDAPPPAYEGGKVDTIDTVAKPAY